MSEKLLAVRGLTFWGAPVIGALYLLGAPALLGLAWLALQVTGPDTAAYRPTVFVALVVVLLLLTYAVTRYALPRQGGADFFDDRVVVYKSWSKVEAIPWDDLANYSLGTGYVQLHRKGEPKTDRRIAFPTPDPEVRERVVALLQTRGITPT